MKAINIKLATFSFAAMLLASCSDSNSDGSSAISQMNTKIVPSEIEQADAQELESKVYNFKSTVSSTKSRAFDTSSIQEILSMPTEPTKAEIEAKAKDITTVDTQTKDLKNGSFYVPEGKTFDLSTNWAVENTTIYVEKGATLNWGTGFYTQSAKVYVLDEGTVETSLENFGQQTDLYCWGTFNFKGESLVVGGKSFFINKSLDFSEKTLNAQGHIFINGDLLTKNFKCNGPYVNVKGNMTISDAGKDQQQNGGVLNVDGTLTIKGDINLNSAATWNSGCAIHIDGTMNVNSGTYLYVKYLKAKKIIESSGANIVLANQSYIECEEFEDNNADNYYWKACMNGSGSKLEGDNAVAVIKADKFSFNTGGPTETGTEKYDCFMFATPSKTSKIVLDGKFYKQDKTTEIIPSFPGTQIYWASDKANSSDVKIFPTSCNGNGGWEPKDPDPKKPIVPISVIESDHTHAISATCVQPYSDKMYMSYHTRGKMLGSCVEVFQPVDDNNEVKLLQYVYDKTGYLDWNHLMVFHKGDKKQVYVAGHHEKKSGVLGYIDINTGGLLNTAPKTIVTEDGENKTIQPFQILPYDANVKGTDENCIVYDDKSNRFIVMTTRGYVTYDPETLNELEKVDKPGKAKHVAIGDGKIVTLVFTEQAKYDETKNPEEAAKEQINAQLEVRNRDAEMSSTPLITIKTPAVLPHYGKNSIVVKNSKIYVCLGAAGLYCYDLNSGAELGHYQMPSPIIQDSKEGKVGAYKAYANGVYVGDDGKVYIAYGSYGVVVLKAGTLEAGAPETLAHAQEGKSANYITVYKGYIYVAYGLKSLQVYQLLDNATNSSDVKH